MGQHPAQARGGAWGKKFAERGRGGGLGPLRAGERGAPAAWIQRVGGGILGIDGVGHAGMRLGRDAGGFAMGMGAIFRKWLRLSLQ